MFTFYRAVQIIYVNDEERHRLYVFISEIPCESRRQHPDLCSYFLAPLDFVTNVLVLIACLLKYRKDIYY